MTHPHSPDRRRLLGWIAAAAAMPWVAACGAPASAKVYKV